MSDGITCAATTRRGKPCTRHAVVLWAGVPFCAIHMPEAGARMGRRDPSARATLRRLKPIRDTATHEAMEHLRSLGSEEDGT